MHEECLDKFKQWIIDCISAYNKRKFRLRSRDGFACREYRIDVSQNSPARLRP